MFLLFLGVKDEYSIFKYGHDFKDGSLGKYKSLLLLFEVKGHVVTKGPESQLYVKVGYIIDTVNVYYW